jgi:hypothetical protein
VIGEVRPNDLEHTPLSCGRQLANEHADALERPHADEVLREVVGERLGREDDAPA